MGSGGWASSIEASLLLLFEASSLLLLELGSLRLREDVLVSEDELEDAVGEEEDEDDEEVFEELLEDDEDEDELELGKLFCLSGGRLRFEWMWTDELDPGSLTVLVEEAAVLVDLWLVAEDVEEDDLETLLLDSLDLGLAAGFIVSSASNRRPLAIDDGFVLASYCCLESLPNEMLLAVLCGRFHASRRDLVRSAMTPCWFAKYLFRSTSIVLVIKKGPLHCLAISDHGSWPDSSVDCSKSTTSSEYLHRT